MSFPTTSTCISLWRALSGLRNPLGRAGGLTMPSSPLGSASRQWRLGLIGTSPTSLVLPWEYSEYLPVLQWGWILVPSVVTCWPAYPLLGSFLLVSLSHCPTGTCWDHLANNWLSPTSLWPGLLQKELNLRHWTSRAGWRYRKPRKLL